MASVGVNEILCLKNLGKVSADYQWYSVIGKVGASDLARCAVYCGWFFYFSPFILSVPLVARSKA
jgi:hypothetical protein